MRITAAERHNESLAAPASARHLISGLNYSAQSVFCATRDRETLTANIATTSNGPNGGSEALGTAHSTMLAGIILATSLENAASTHKAKYCLGHTPERKSLTL